MSDLPLPIIVAQNHAKLVGWLRKRGAGSEAEDIAQDTWTALHLQGKSAPVFAYVVARNKLLQWHEHERRGRGVSKTCKIFGSSTPDAACRYCGNKIYANGLCLTHYARDRRGSSMAKPKMKHHSDAVVAEVRQLLAEGVKGREIGKRVGMSEAQVSRIKNGKQRTT